MQKISLEIVNRIVEENISNDEINFLLYIAQFQNELGQVRGIHYRTAIIALNISKPQFYNIIRTMEEKKFITVDWSNSRYWNFVINDNVFLTREDNKKGYLNINRTFLHSITFKNMKANIKQLVLKLLTTYRENQNFKISIEKLCSWINVKGTRLMLQYLEAIKEWFNVRITGNGIYIIQLKIDERRPQSETSFYFKNFIEMFCSNYKIGFTPDTIKDLIILLGQYKSKLNKLYCVICSTCLQYHTIEPALINSIMSGK